MAGKEMMMFGREKNAKVSDKSKKFKSVPPAKSRFGFGKRQFQGMKGKPTNYGSA